LNQTDIRLQSLTFENIKGFNEKYTVNFDGKNADIFGRNATRKSSIYDLFLWILFGKDSSNRSDYMIKPQDEDGNEQHHLESIVEGILTVDGKPLKLKRMLSEKWSKNQKTKTIEFSGNETSYWVNDVPVKAKDYAIEIGTIIKENIFKLLTNPLFFNTNEKGFGWQERRKILFEICGNVSDAEVIDSVVTIGDKSMLDLLNVINSGRTIDNHKLVVAEKIKNTKSSMEGIPSRIDEQKRTIPTDAVDYVAIETSLQAHKATLRAIELELATNAQGASLYRQKQQQAYKLQNEINARKLEIEVETGAESKKLVDEKSSLDSEKYLISTEIKRLGAKSEFRIADLDIFEKTIIDLREIWSEENAKQFVSPDGFNCPTCEQSLPEGKTQEKIDKLKENFDKNKTQVLAGIRKQGTDAADRSEVLNKEKEIDSTSLTTLEGSLKRINDRLVELEAEIEKQQQPTTTINYDDDPTYSILHGELQDLQTELDKPIEDTTTELLTKKREATDQIETLNKTLSQKEVVSKAKIRIDELKAEESKLAGELSEYERQDYLIKQFTSAKVKMLEDAINNRFETVKFKLFDVLNDGTEKEVCRTLVNTNGVWVEFDGANNGGKINAGLSIIQMLSEFYGVSCPIFVDNAESVTGFVDIKSQVIKLVVSEQDLKLRVEVQ
jgi:exonuclease SbcC